MSSFLKNTGDIILDAVLTDEGRRRLSLGDGSFKIAKFGLGDDEINYGTYDATATTGQEDVELMKTPIFEAYTNNASSMKSKLITVEDNNLLYLPVMVANTAIFPFSTANGYSGSYFVPVFVSDPTNTVANQTFSKLTGSTDSTSILGTSANQGKIYVDQGFNSSDTDKTKNLKTESVFLYESEYNVIVDDRLATLFTTDGTAITQKSVDDDGMATYSFTENTSQNVVAQMPPSTGNGNDSQSSLLGTRGSRLKFTVGDNINLRANNILFTRLGSTVTIGGNTFKIIRSTIKVIGVTTGYSLEIPVIFAKYSV